MFRDVHEVNIIHADIKPGNFLLVAGELKLIDFGLAMELVPGYEYVQRKNIQGTKEYMSPEVHLHKYSNMLNQFDCLPKGICWLCH